MTKTYLLNFLTTHKEELKKSYKLLKIGLFGSYAKDKAGEHSDIELFIIDIFVAHRKSYIMYNIQTFTKPLSNISSIKS